LGDPVDHSCLEEAARRWRLRYIVLYGSHSAGRPRPGSDVDLAVKAGRRLSAREYMRLYADLAECVHGDLDLWIVEYWSPIIAWEALWRGRLLWACEGCTPEYHWDRARALREAADLEYLVNRLGGAPRNA